MKVVPLRQKQKCKSLQDDANTFKLLQTISKPINDTAQGMALLALQAKNASIFAKTGETWPCSRSRAASSNNAGVIINKQ